MQRRSTLSREYVYAGQGPFRAVRERARTELNETTDETEAARNLLASNNWHLPVSSGNEHQRETLSSGQLRSRQEVDVMTAEHAGTHQVPPPRGRALVDELLQQKDVQPIRTPEDTAGRDIFESEEELHEFLDYTYAARRSELA
jgi:hypothetical protein